MSDHSKIRDAQTAVRVLRVRLAAALSPVAHVVVGASLDRIDAGLAASAEQLPAPPAAPAEPPPTLSELELAVVRTALADREKTLALRHAPMRAQLRESVAESVAFRDAVERLARAREAEAMRAAGLLPA